MEAVDPFRFIFAFLFVTGLIAGCGFMLKRYSRTETGAFFLSQRFGQTGITSSEKARLSVIEIRPLDSKRKLVLVRRDKVEHLLLLADNRELVIESGITPATDTTHA